jgi:IS30 family transposase
MSTSSGCPLPPRRDYQRQFWRSIRAGLSVEEASACLGIESRTGRRWVRKAGGVPPVSLVEPVRTRTLNIAEREKILTGITVNLSIRAIAASIDRAPSTVSRELAQHMRHKYIRPPGDSKQRRVLGWDYSPNVAQRRADAAAARPKVAKLADHPRLRQEVQDRLELEHSPEQIAARLRVEFPDEPEMWVSHETIYQSLYVQARGALRRDLTVRLRTGRALRKPRRRSGERRGRIPGMVNISQRPAEVEHRAVPGHWEGDLIIGKNGASAIGTLVERTTRFCLLLHLPRDHAAEAVRDAMLATITTVPAHLRRSLTWDQGTEMRRHAEITLAADMKIYFCDPHSPWQRGSNENTNGLLRQYFPKSTDLSVYAPDYLEHVAMKLNNRPRKRHDWRTPAETLDQLLSEPFNPPAVALTG